MSYESLLVIIDFVILILGIILMFLGFERNSDILFYAGVSLIILFIVFSLIIIAMFPPKNDVVYVPIIVPVKI